MSYTEFSSKALVILLTVILTAELLSTIAYSYHESTTYPDEPSVYDLWNVSSEERLNRQVKDYLRDMGWVSDKVDGDELDYICCMAVQLTSHYNNISPSLALAVIAVESRFDRNSLSSGGARGLMQLIPSYHEDRLIQFLEEDERYSRDLFYEPLYNIMTGLDYLNERLEKTNGDVAYALMQYNQGPTSAYRAYVQKHITSKYAKQIIELSDELDTILGQRKQRND